MQAQPAVSVVLPVYDGERHLRSAIDSVLAQTFSDFELVICDDASRDGSRAILESYSDPRVRLVHHAHNRGLFPTLNDLVRASRAPLVRLWAQDDLMYAQCLERELRFFAAHPSVAMAWCAFDVIDEHGTLVERAKLDATPEELSPAQASELMLYYGSLPGNIANVMLRRSTFDAVGLFREDMKVSGDFEMWARIAERLTLGRNRETLIQLRRHAGQLSRSAGVLPVFMRENLGIYATLLARLPPPARAAARRYSQRHIGSQYAHHAVRCLLRGELGGARDTLLAMRQYDAAAPAFFWWLATGNGRWLKPQPRLTTF